MHASRAHPEVGVGGGRAVALHVDEPGRRRVVTHAQRRPQLLAQDARLGVPDLQGTRSASGYTHSPCTAVRAKAWRQQRPQLPGEEKPIKIRPKQ